MRNRRAFLAQLGAATAAIGLAPGSLLAGVAGAEFTDSEQGITRERFLSSLNKPFSFLDPRSGIQRTLQLVAVQLRPSTPYLDQFCLIFDSESSTALRTGTYLVTDAAGRLFPLYVQPEPSSGTGARCRADCSLILAV